MCFHFSVFLGLFPRLLYLRFELYVHLRHMHGTHCFCVASPTSAVVLSLLVLLDSVGEDLGQIRVLRKCSSFREVNEENT